MGNRLRGVFQLSFSLAMPFSNKWVTQEPSVPGQILYIVPAASPENIHGPLPQWVCLELLKREVSWRIPELIREPPQFAPFSTKQQQQPFSEHSPDLYMLTTLPIRLDAELRFELKQPFQHPNVYLCSRRLTTVILLDKDCQSPFFEK